MTILLINKIASMLIMMLAGVLLVKLKLVRPEESRLLSTIAVYLILPVTIVRTFQIELSKDVASGFLLMTVVAVLILLGFVLLGIPSKKIFKLTPVEQASIVYSNAGNLILPLVSATLGDEYIIYATPFMAVQLVFLWSHGKMVICGERGFDLRKVLLNVNIISVGIGVVVMLTGLRFPGLIDDTMASISSLLAPVSMLTTGFLLGGMNLRRIVMNKRIWLVSALRLLVFPLISLVLLKYSGLASLMPDGKKLLMISLFAAAAPSAATVMQQAQVYGHDADYAGAINVITTTLCVVTMPLLTMLYEL
ncbi:MAG: AEC family transporter [Lachnospiraceae bacterium]|nr:AEC family transporter [Lachnospiraceae bacterium]